jgi:nucleoside-diphosphate-sugar epimerase
MSRVLITGGTGSLGSMLARRLIEDGCRPAVLIPPGAGLGGLTEYQGRFEVVTGDLTDPASLSEAVRGITEVYHLAGEPILLNRLGERMHRINVLGAQSMAVAAARAGVRRFVHTSSVSAVGYPPDGEVADESFEFGRTVTRNAYLVTKRAGEQAVLEVGRQTGMPVVVVNPAGVVAPYSHRRYGWAALVDSALRGRLTGWFPGGVALCSGADLVRGQTAAMRVGRPGERYILSSANLSYRELFGLVCATLGQRPPRFGVPAALLRAAAVVCRVYAGMLREPLRSPLLVPENAALAVRTLYYDPARARRELGLTGDRAELADSIRDTARWLTTGSAHARR